MDLVTKHIFTKFNYTDISLRNQHPLKSNVISWPNNLKDQILGAAPAASRVYFDIFFHYNLCYMAYSVGISVICM